MSRRTSISHVIYDMDGLLLDTEPIYTRANSIIAARHGKVFNWTVKSRMIGRKASDSAPIIIEALELPLTPEQYLEARRPLLEEQFPGSQPLPGARRLTQHLHRHGIPQAVATASDRHHFRLKTSRHREWFSLFEFVLFADDPDVAQGKPAPDIFLVAGRRLRAPPSSCLVFEDAPAGVLAARAAGMLAVAVVDPNLRLEEFESADQVLRSLEEFDPAAWGLPPYD